MEFLCSAVNQHHLAKKIKAWFLKIYLGGKKSPSALFIVNRIFSNPLTSFKDRGVVFGQDLALARKGSCCNLAKIAVIVRMVQHVLSEMDISSVKGEQHNTACILHCSLYCM